MDEHKAGLHWAPAVTNFRYLSVFVHQTKLYIIDEISLVTINND